MTTYTTIPNTDIDADSPINVNLMTLLRDNPIAITEGATGAPKIQDAAFSTNSINGDKLIDSSITQGKIASSAIGQSQLKTTTASTVGATIGTNTSVNFSLAGGTYSWYQAGIAITTGTTGHPRAQVQPAAAGQVTFTNSDPDNSSAYTVYERYVQASPPYAFGSIYVPLFIYVIIDNSTSKIEGVSVAQDPTWAYHGPTDIRADYIDEKSGKRFKSCFVLENEGITLREAKAKNKAAFKAFKDGNVKLIKSMIEINTDFKNSDMNEAPHPWFDNDASIFSGKTFLLVDPTSLPMQMLFDLYREVDASEVANLINEDYLKIENIQTGLHCPSSLMPVKVKWKNTGNK